ncbi:hypothetical protein F4780DRAFT_780678 [Xylariomycetidae sp. FL0641]|nr:hypothetical protein F4780DRAFT_780678 [Xylariomycetidae sp. FL0641]
MSIYARGPSSIISTFMLCSLVVVTVYGNRIEARYWYDGRNIVNAREDAAEAALNWLATNPTTTPRAERKANERAGGDTPVRRRKVVVVMVVAASDGLISLSFHRRPQPPPTPPQLG